MGKKINVDTSMFRRAIWNYIQCMFGIRHDDYDYHEVNELLDRNFKSYIKTLCCFPHRISKKDCDNAMREFRESEKVTIIAITTTKAIKKAKSMSLTNSSHLALV